MLTGGIGFASQMPSPVRYKPKAMSARAAIRASRLAVPRVAAQVFPGCRVSLLPVLDKELWHEAGQWIELDVRIGGETAHIRTAWAVLEKLIHLAEPRVRVADLDTDAVGAFIETYALSEIEALETMFGVTCSVERLEKCRDHGTLANLDAQFEFDGQHGRYPAKIFGSPVVLGMLATAWETRPQYESQSLTVPFVLAARVATSNVSRAGLRSIAVGDALLFDRVAPESGIVLSIGEYLATVGRIIDDGAVVANAPFTMKSPYLLGEFLMTESDGGPEHSAGALEETSIANLPVRLVFEVGRKEMTLDELRAIAIGSPINLEKPATSIVDILANGRKIGSGEMVLIGDQLGVRVMRLNGHG